MRGWSVGLCVLLVSGACSDGDTAGSTGGRLGSNSPAVVGAPAGAAAGSGAPDMAPSGFGNSSIGIASQQEPAAGSMQCTEGFCGPTAADSDCGSFIVNTDVEVTQTPGNLLVVFDQSASMDEPWPATGTTKLQAAQKALSDALAPIKDLLTVGAIFLPTTACAPGRPSAGAVAPITGQGQIPFMPGAQFLTAWDMHWAAMPPGLAIGTPLEEAFMRADEALTSTPLTGATIVVAFTDGAPNCFTDSGGGIGGLPIGPAAGGLPGQQPTSDFEKMRAADWLAMKGIKTYVVGLPGAQGVQVLNDIAVSGGTMSYIVPENSMGLETKLRIPEPLER